MSTTAWRDVEAGRRELDRVVALGDPDDAGYLTPPGRQVLERMTQVASP